MAKTTKKTTKKIKKPVRGRAASGRKKTVKKQVKKKPAKTRISKQTQNKKKIIGKKVQKPKRYWEATGRRKTAVARVRIFRGTGLYKFEDKNADEYFKNKDAAKDIEAPFKKVGQGAKFDMTVKVRGGGQNSQLDATVHGIAQSLTKVNPNFKVALKKIGLITRDPRMKERKKYGLRGARRAPQWSKR